LSNIIQDITPNIKLLNFCPPSSGFENFITSWLLSGSKKALVDVGPQVTIPGLLAAFRKQAPHPMKLTILF